MSQTLGDQKDANPRRSRPGQRQQERLIRLARRRRRQRIIIGSIVAVLLVVVGSLAFWQYQQYQNRQTVQQNQHATATAQAMITPTPSAGPATPPHVSGQTGTLPGGLQYIDVKQGTGATLQNGDTVSVQYTGWLQSTGKKFDSSYDHGGQPFNVTIGQGQVIKGWDEGLVGMKVGGTRRLIIPSSLAYGDQGSPPTIPPKATLIFDIVAVSKG